jgi:flagellar basal body rod protein FlgG
MKLFGGITVVDDTKSIAVRGMRSQMKLLEMITTNISRFGMPGYQKKIPVKTSFSEYIGSHAVDGITDTQPGRIRRSGNPMDFALEEHGYFQSAGPNGIKLSRDGRFEINPEGYLINLNKEKVLGADGEPIRFQYIPGDLKDITVDSDGTVNLYNRTYKQKVIVGRLSIAAEDGTPAGEVKVRQGFVEDSNVNLADEFFNLIPIRRNFEAQRQTLIINSGNYDKLLQMLGRSS